MMTTKEAAKKLFVCDAAIRKYIREGLGPKNDKVKLKAIKVMKGARVEYRITLKDFDDFKKSRINKI
jgi:hypothetical protein